VTPVPSAEPNLSLLASEKRMVRRELANGFAFRESAADMSAQSPRVMQVSDWSYIAAAGNVSAQK
jgi:hypothetical protein